MWEWCPPIFSCFLHPPCPYMRVIKTLKNKNRGSSNCPNYWILQLDFLSRKLTEVSSQMEQTHILEGEVRMKERSNLGLPSS